MPDFCLVHRPLRRYDRKMNNFQKDQKIREQSDYSGAPLISSDDYLRLRQYPWSEALAEELERAIVVPTEQLPTDVVTMHARFAYEDLLTGALREIELVFPEETDPAQGKISVLTPVGSAMIGLRVGQEITWEFPDGSTHCLRVISVAQSDKSPLASPAHSPLP